MDLDIALPLLKAEMSKWPQCNGWKVRITRAHDTLGVTEPAKRTIGLSGPYVSRAPVADVLETIRHEIAHVLSGAAGRAEKPGGHGPIWARCCEKVGIEPEISGCATNGTGPRWKGFCGCRTKTTTAPPSPEAFCNKCGGEVIWITAN